MYGGMSKTLLLATIIMSPMFLIAAGCTLWLDRNATCWLVRMARPQRSAQTFR
jgi:uncharacterized iron-regulated membrane protein